MEFGQHRAQLARAGGDHVEYAARRTRRHLLLQPRHPRAVGHAHLAVIRGQVAGHHPQQGRFAGAIATDEGHALAGTDRQAHLFEQQRSADADVDAFESDQGHAPILPARC